MTEQKEITGKFRYDQDSKRFHRFKIENDDGVTGSLYVPRDKTAMPKKIILEYAGKKS